MSCGVRIIADLGRWAYIRPIGTGCPGPVTQPDGERHERHRSAGRQRQICAVHPSLQGRALGYRQGRHQGTALRRHAGSTCPTACRWLVNWCFLRPRRGLVSQIQGRTYANVFGLVERFITAKLIDVSREHALGDQNALEALVRFSDEEIKHQALFRRIEAMMARDDAGRLSLRRRSRRGCARRARQGHLGGARAHAAHRAVRAAPLPAEHRARRRALGTVQGRVPVPLEG